MSSSNNKLENTDQDDLEFKDPNIDKNEYIKSLEISVQLLQREIDSLRQQLTKARANEDLEKIESSDNPYSILSDITSRKSLVKKLDEILNEKFDFLENSIFEVDHNSKLIPYFNDPNLESFYKFSENLEEDGIIDWVSETGEIQVVPNLEESTERTVVNSVIYCIKIKGFRDSVFIAKTTKSKTQFSNETLSELKELLSATAVLLDNIISKEEIKKINKRIEKKSSDSNDTKNIFNIATGVVENIYQALGIIDANVKMIESGIGDSGRRVELINENSNKIRETGKKFLNLLNESKSNRTEEKLKNITADVIFLIRSQLLRDGIKIFDDIDEDLKIKGNIAFVEKVILTIILIIRDTLKDGGVINISANRNKNHTILKIADNGLGLPIEDVTVFNLGNKVTGEKEELFEKISSINSSLKKYSSKIEISSVERSGTTYNLYLKN